MAVEEISSRIQVLYNSKKTLEESLANKKSPHMEDIKKRVFDLKSNWSNANGEEKKVMLQSIIKRIYVYDSLEQTRIELNF